MAVGGALAGCGWLCQLKQAPGAGEAAGMHQSQGFALEYGSPSATVLQTSPGLPEPKQETH